MFHHICLRRRIPLPDNTDDDINDDDDDDVDDNNGNNDPVAGRNYADG